MKETKKKLKKCSVCETQLNDPHFNRKYCDSCAQMKADEGARASIKRWKKRNPDRVKELNKSWAKRFPIKKRLSHARSIARGRGIVCEITDEQFVELWNKVCIYCNMSITDQTGVGLDRINNDLGYTINNVLPCCGTCNYIRGDYLTVPEMKVAIKAVLEFRNENRK